jgi:putative hydrolase of the HAD superfamily
MVGAVIEAVLLDVGGVFFVPEPEPLSEALRRFGVTVSPADLQRGHYAGITAFDRAGAGDWADYHRGVVDACGVAEHHGEEAVALVRKVMDSAAWNQVVPGSVDGLRRLAEIGVAIGIVSNSNGTVEEQLLVTAVCQAGPGAGVEVGVVLDSHVVGIDKPDPRIFHMALDRLGADPQGTVHVGDTVSADIHGARAAGILPLHLDPHGFCLMQDHQHVRSLDDVVLFVLESRA